MLYQKPAPWNRLRHVAGLRNLAAFAAGIHTANGLAHGITPPRQSMSHPQQKA